MTSTERVSEMLSTEGGQKNFLEWAGSEVTQLMLAAARELTQPGIPASSDAGAIGLALGKVIGAAMVVDYLSHPYRERVEQELTPGYGAESILKENGYA